MADNLQRVGLVFKADGAVDFNKSLKEVNASIQENRSAFKLAKSAWDDSTSSADKLKVTQKYLADQTKDYSDKVKMLEGELEELEGAENKNGQAIQKKKDQLNTAKTSLNNYKRGLEEVNDKLKNGTAQLDEYAKKITDLGTKTTEAGKKMSKGVTVPLLGIGAAGIKVAMELDEGYDTIISKTGATGDTLQELNDAADEVFSKLPVDMADVGAAVGEINTRFGVTGDSLESLTEKFIRYADINDTDVNTSVQLVSRAMGDAGIPMEEAGTLLDKLTAAGQASGISIDKLTENITKYGAPMRALGLTTDESIAIFAGWEKAGVNTEIAFSGMKKAIGTWGKEGKDATEEFKKTLKAIQEAPDISTATSIAIEDFGQKAGPDLADAIKGGRFEYEDFLKIIQDSEGIVQTTFDSMQDPWDQAKTSLNNLKLAGAELGNALLETLGPMLQTLSDKVKEFSEWFRGLDDSQQQTIVTIGLVVAAIGPLLVIFGSVFSGIGKIIGTTSQIIGVVTSGGPKILGVVKTIGAGAKGLFGIIAANPVIAIVGGVIAAVVLLYTKCEWFRDGVNNILGKVAGFFKAAGDKIKKFLDFDWKLPKIKLPHFKLTGEFSFIPPRVPKIDVKWYAKGGILNSPTIFGMGNGGNLLGGGEAGKEAVLPIEKLRTYIREENQINNRELAAMLNQILSGVTLETENNIYIGDRKFFDIITEMAVSKIGRKQASNRMTKGVV